MNIFAKKKISLGIDIGTSSIKAASITKIKDEIVLAKAAIIERSALHRRSTDKAELVNSIKKLIHDNNITYSFTVSSFYERSESIRYINIPAIPEQEIAEALKWKMKDTISYPLDKVTIDYIINKESVEQDKKEYEIIAVAANTDSLNEENKLFKEAGIKLNIIDINPLAILNIVRIMKDYSREKNIAVVDLGDKLTEINIIRKGKLSFTRIINEGGYDLSQIIKDRLNIDIHEAEILKKKGVQDNADNNILSCINEKTAKLILNIERSIDFFRAQFREQSIDKVILTGGETINSEITNLIHKGLAPLKVEVLNPFEHIKIGKGCNKEYFNKGQLFSVAIGLGLRGILYES